MLRNSTLTITLVIALMTTLIFTTVSCKKEVDPTKSCLKPTNIISIVDPIDLGKYSFSLEGPKTDLTNQILWKIVDANNKLINTATISLDQPYTYNFNYDGTYKVIVETTTNCGDKVNIESMLSVVLTIPIASSFPLVEQMVYKKIGAIAVTNSGIVMIQEQNKIKIWDYSNKTLLKTLDGGYYINQNLKLSVDDKDLFSTSDNKIFDWDWKTGTLKRTLSADAGFIRSINISPDNKYLVSSSDNTSIRLWNISTGELIKTINSDYFPNSVSVSSDRKYVVACFGSFFIVFDGITGKEIWKQLITTNVAYNVIIDSNGERIFTNTANYSTDKYNVIVWNVKNKSIEKTFDSVYGWALSSDGQYYVTSTSVIDVKSLSVLWTKQDNDVGLSTISSAGKFVARASSYEDDLVSLYLPSTGEDFSIISEKHKHLIQVGAISDNGRLMSIVDKSKVKVWNPINGQPLNVDFINSNYFHDIHIKDNILTALGGRPCPEIVRWDISLGSSIPMLKQTIRSNAGIVCDSTSSLSQDGNFVIYSKNGDPDETTIWDINSAKEFFHFKGKYLGMSTDNKIVYYFDVTSGNIKISDISTNKEVKSIKFSNSSYISHAVISNDGTYLAASTYPNILTIVNLTNGLILSRLPFSNMEDIFNIAFSNDNKNIAFGDSEHILIKDIVSGLTLKDGQFNDPIKKIKFHPKGKALYVITEKDFSVLNMN